MVFCRALTGVMVGVFVAVKMVLEVPVELRDQLHHLGKFAKFSPDFITQGRGECASLCAAPGQWVRKPVFIRA